MATTYQVIALSSIDPEGSDRRDEPRLLYPDALQTAKALKSQGKAFRVYAEGPEDKLRLQELVDLGAIVGT